jgi:precorrin-6A/cobalt-precorrin-6A reductase
VGLKRKHVLILGGTREGINLATALSHFTDLQITTSLAGRTQNPVVPGTVRTGGFGGVAGLTEYLQSQQIGAIIDATHPFAAQITWNAATAAKAAGVPHLMFVRPAWTKAEGDHWIEVSDHDSAARAASNLSTRVFLTIGRQELAAYAAVTDVWFLMRMIEPPEDKAKIPKGQILLDKGPFTLESERALLIQHGIEAIVSKNSGGKLTAAKLAAARELALPVVMIQRPSSPNGLQTSSIEAAVRWLLDCFI